MEYVVPDGSHTSDRSSREDWPAFHKWKPHQGNWSEPSRGGERYDDRYDEYDRYEKHAPQPKKQAPKKKPKPEEDFRDARPEYPSAPPVPPVGVPRFPLPPHAAFLPPEARAAMLAATQGHGPYP